MKYYLTLLFLSFSLSISSASASEKPALLEENNFKKLSIEMKEKSLGLLLMLHAEDCPYCRLMEREILSPMVISGDYDKKILIREFQIDKSGTTTDFSGEEISPRKFADRYGLALTPTLLFLDSKGEEVVKKMVGINTVELFGAYLDIEVDKLAEKIKAENR